jgi:uncharacterized membrane protein YhhN
MDLPRASAAAYVVLAVTDTALAGTSDSAALPGHGARALTKPLLMPTLAAAFAGSTRGSRDPVRRATLIAQGLSGVGDVSLLGRGDRAFLTGLGGFLGAHVAYVAGFAHAAAPDDPDHPAPRNGARAATALFLVAGPAMGWAAGRTSSRLRLPVVAYAGALCAMAATASRVGSPTDASARRALLAGTGLFLLSDSLLGAREFVLDPRALRTRRALDVAVMATYTAAQGLLATGVARVVRSRQEMGIHRQETGTTSS